MTVDSRRSTVASLSLQSRSLSLQSAGLSLQSVVEVYTYD